MASYYEFINPRWIWRTLIIVGGIAIMLLISATWQSLDRLGDAVAVAEYDRRVFKVELRDLKTMIAELREAVHDFATSRRRAIEALREHDNGR